MSELIIRAGQVYVGRGVFAGMLVHVLEYEPECDRHYGMAMVRMRSSDASIADAERAHDAAWKSGIVSAIDAKQAWLDRERSVRIEMREREWFVSWLRHGLIAEDPNAV